MDQKAPQSSQIAAYLSKVDQDLVAYQETPLLVY